MGLCYHFGMQLPKRRSTMLLKRDDDSAVFLTPQAIQHLKDEIVRLEKTDRPKIVVDLSHALSLGDFSENAEYQDAKARLARLDGRVHSLKERLKRAVEIEAGSPDRVGLGSTVTVLVNGKEKTYRIVGPHETDPTRGRISHVSPLGIALRDHGVGDEIELKTESGVVIYKIISLA